MTSTSNTYYGVVALLFLFFGAALFKKYTDKQQLQKINGDIDPYKAIQKYLLNKTQLNELETVNKPILWIHIPLEYNARHWQSFGSRSSYDLNQPYLYLTVRSIIQHCDSSFKICLVDDASFQKLIPGMEIDLTKVAAPMLDYIRQLMIANLIYKYGGMVVPISFICFQDLTGLYQKGVQSNSMFVCENKNTNVSASHADFSPDIRFMGAKKESQVVRDCMDFMQRQISRDYTAQIDFLGEFNRWITARSNQICIISGAEIGTKTLDDSPVLVDTLLGSETDVLDFCGKTYGIWIPADDILKRTRYNWFARCSLEQVVNSNTVLGKYILLANSPDKNAVTEALTTNNDNNETINNLDEDNELKKPDWISFWKTPSGINVWGLKPQFLGNTVPRAYN